VAVLDAVLGMALGLLVSAFAATEFQAVQFMPAFVLPQFLLCGLLVPRADLDTALRWVSDALPLSYAVDAMRDIVAREDVGSGTWADLSVVLFAIVLSLALGAVTLRRRTG
jgi:ABC-2 type transport system permease protein